MGQQKLDGSCFNVNLPAIGMKRLERPWAGRCACAELAPEEAVHLAELRSKVTALSTTLFSISSTALFMDAGALPGRPPVTPMMAFFGRSPIREDVLG